MKILMLCNCGKKITLEKSEGIFKSTCRACHREHRIKAEITNYAIKQTHTAREKTDDQHPRNGFSFPRNAREREEFLRNISRQEEPRPAPAL
jgi:hypothetical protein